MRTGYKVCDVMTRKPIAVTPEMTVRDAAKLMKEKDVGSLVIKLGDELKGFITEQDIVYGIATQGMDPNKVTVQDIMVKHVETIAPDKDIYDALMKMRDLDIRWLPVLDSGKLVGLLTLKSILKIQPQLFDILLEKLEVGEQILRTESLEGTCDSCGEYFDNLHELEGEFLCKRCFAHQRSLM